MKPSLVLINLERYNMTATKQIEVSLSNGVMHIGIYRPDKKNALTSKMYADMQSAVEAASENEAVKVLLFHGTQDTFSAGNDLQDFKTRDFSKPSKSSLFVYALNECPKPVVAAVSGIAVGIGATMLLHCDLVYASPTRFSMPFVNLGACPEAGSSLLMPKLAGQKKANEILMLGDFFDTASAIDSGLVNAELPKEDVLNHAIAIAERLAKKPQQSLQTTKQLLKKADQQELAEHMKLEFKLFGEMLQSDESKQARCAS